MLKDIGFIKFLIELKESQKIWATVVCCAIIVVIQQRSNDISEIEYRNELRLESEKMRIEKNMIIERKDAMIQVLNDSKVEDMRDFKNLYFETERVKLKIQRYDSIIQKKI